LQYRYDAPPGAMPHDSHRRPSIAHHELAAILRPAAIFSRLTDEQLAALAGRTRLVDLDAGEILFQRGDKARAVYLVVAGQLKLYRTSAAGDEVIIEVLEAGATFGESRAILADPHFHLSCATLADSTVAAVDLTTFLAQLRDSVESCLLLLERMSERAERQVDEIERLALQSSTCRVAGYLLGQLPPGRDEYVLRVTKGVMASRLAIRAETLSRILKQLSAEGVVSVSSRNVVRVHSQEKLRRLAAEQSAYLPGGGERRRIGKGR
jgi:CRP-like cAMP-binding protein